MKKIFLFGLLICLLQACTKKGLDVFPGDKFSEGNFWKNQDQATSALTGVYTTLQEPGSVWDGFTTYTWGAGGMTDDAIGTYGAFQNNTVTPTDGTVSGLWSQLYSKIRTCNVFLANISKPTMDEAVRKSYIAQAKFIRAYLYSILVNNWGDVPLILEPLTVSQLKVPKTAKAEVVKFILTELDAAAADLPAAYGATDLGRVTKGAALALKARELLYNADYAGAAVAAKAVMDLNQYALFQDATGTGYYTVHRMANEGNKETVFSVRYRMPEVFYYYISRIQPALYTGEGGNYQVLQSFVDAFECTDGNPISSSPLFNAANEFANRDPRLAMAVIKSGDNFGGAPIKAASVANNYTGYYPRKFYEATLVDWGNGQTDPIFIRYAEILLIYAEAKIESGSIDQSVLDAINSIRARAYGKSVTDVANYPAITTTNQSQLREIVRRERRVELGLEYNDCRLNDIRRWKIYENVISGVARGAKDATGATTNYRKMFDFTFNKKLYQWPIPQSEIDLIGAEILKQNPDYN